MKRLAAPLLVVLQLTLVGHAAGIREQADRQVVINGVRLTAAELHYLDGASGAGIPDAHYWYDPVSGLWGLEGGPSLGQTMAGVDVGGRLRRDASGGRTGVVVNGREIHRTELQFLVRLFEVVNPGRYWLNADGIGGYEGGPARFNLRAAAGGPRRGSILGHSDTGSVIGGMYLAPGGGRE